MFWSIFGYTVTKVEFKQRNANKFLLSLSNADGEFNMVTDEDDTGGYLVKWSIMLL